MRNIININNGLSQNSVTALQTDTLGRLWIGTANKLHYYNGYEVNTINTTNDRVTEIYKKDSTIFYLTINQLTAINVVDFSMQSVKLPVKDFYTSYQTNSGLILITSDKSDTTYFDYDLTEKNFIPYNWSNVYPNKKIINFAGASVEYGRNGINIINPTGETEEISNLYCSSAIQVDSSLYIASQNGIFILTLKDNHITHKVVFEDYNIESLLKDRNNNLWVGTARNGLFLYHHNNIHSNFYTIKKTKKENDMVYWTVFEHQNELFVCTSSGILRLSAHSNLIPLEKITQHLNCISAISCQNGLLIGTATQGIFKFRDNHLTNIYKSENSTLSNTIMQIIPNDIGFLAINKTGYIQLDQKGNFLDEKFNSNGGTYYSMHLRKTKQGNYLSSSTNGIDELDQNLNPIKHFNRFDSRVFTMSAEIDKATWVTSMDGGLFKIVGDSLKKVDFPDSYLLTIIGTKKNKNDFWMSSLTSIYHFKDGVIRPYTKENGFPLTEYNQMGAFQFRNKLYYSGVGGVVAFTPDQNQTLPQNPSLLVMHQQKLIPKELQVPFETAIVNLNVEPILLTDHNLFEISYQFLDSTWKAIDQPQQLNLNSPYGTSLLTFKIKNTVTGVEILDTYQIIRAYPFWQKTWFKIVSVLGAILLLLGIYLLIRFIQTKRQLKQLETERKLERERLRISNELHDNIGARLTYIISSLDIEMHRAGEQNGIEPINQFARETMAQLRETIWAVSNHTIFLSEFSTRVEQYLTQINELTLPDISFNNTLEVDVELSPVQVINLYRIVQEATNNAVKYAEAQHINVAFSNRENVLSLLIEDDGNGFDKTKSPNGSGIKGMHKRAAEINAIISLKSEIKKGTQLKLTFNLETT